MKKSLLIAAALFSLVAIALKPTNGIDGNWSGTILGPEDIKYVSDYSFKTYNGKLTGTVQANNNDAYPISDGIVKGDSLSFSVVVNNGDKIFNKGQYYAIGDSISMSSTFMGGNFHGTLKRVTK